MGAATTAALLAARAFGRIEWMGLSHQQLVRVSLMLGVDRAPFELATVVRRLASPGATTPQLAEEIRAVLQRFAYDPVKLAVYGAKAPVELVGHLLPVELIGSPKATVGPSHHCEKDLLLADAHLHSGASMGLETLIRMLCLSTKSSPPELREVVGHDEIGEPYSVGVIVAALRQFLIILANQTAGKAVEMPPEIMAKWVDGEFWACVGSAAVIGFKDAAVDHPFTWDVLSAVSSVPTATMWDPIQILHKFVSDSVAFGDMRQRRLCEGLMAALFLVNRFLRSSPGEGLPSFVDRFDQMGLLRDSSVSVGRALAVAHSVDCVMTEEQVVAAEFRKSIGASTGTSLADLEQKILRSLADHLAGFVGSSALAAAPRRLSMPVTFLRTRERLENGDAPALIHSLQPLWRLTSAILNVLASHREIGAYVNAVDVAGDELAMPNWVFVPLLDHLGSVGAGTGRTLVRSCHAGESFLARIQGLRSIGELVLPNRVVERVGHALALDRITSDFVLGSDNREYSRRSVVDDMCWMIASGIHAAEARLLLERIVADTNLHAGGIVVEDMVGAWISRRSVSGFQRLGLGNGIEFPPESVTADTARLAGGEQLALLLLTHRAPFFPFDVLDVPLGDNLTGHYEEMNADFGESIAGMVVEAMKSDVVIEACPTSNMRLSGLPRVAYLPIERWQNLGLQVSLNSDDPLIFGSPIMAEAELVGRYYAERVLASLSRVSTESCCAGVEESSTAEYVVIAEMARTATVV
ncbi:hypothetical protein [Nocardia sp. NPDC049149]|uniref:hypothetical protein n=1 Tax=Nocardia sp. NPDC049149 TaxID=3364315 RepID=UPI00371304EF